MPAPMPIGFPRRASDPPNTPPQQLPRSLGDKLQEIAHRAPHYLTAFTTLADHVLHFLNSH